MTDLSKTESTILLEAAARPDAAVILPERLKPVTQQRMLGKLLAQKLIRTGDDDGPAHVIAVAGYRAVGLRPPRRQREARPDGRGTKQALILGLLQREEGASLTELTEATGWLPHTTRAALSRLRSAGTTLIRSPRESGGSAYRIIAAEIVA